MNLISNCRVQLGLKPRDGVQYQLVGDLAYEQIFRSGLSDLQFQVNSLCGESAIVNVPITVQEDPPTGN